MMKVLFISNDFPPQPFGIARGYERVCATVPPDRVLVLGPHLPGDVAFDAKQPYRVVRLRLPMGHHPVARAIETAVLCAHAIRLARSDRFDAIHIGTLHLGPIGLILKLLLKMPYVIYLYGGEMASYMRLRAVRAVARAVVRHARLVVFNSTYTRRQFEAMSIHNPRVEVLSHGVEHRRFHPALDARQIRARYGLDGKKVILTVARLDDNKGHDMVIQALDRVRQSVGPVRYLIVGRGREEQRLRTLASTLGCAEEVIFAGFVPESELPFFYAACDVFIMASRPRRGEFEGLGIVFLEAGACGKPVIGGRSGGVPEAVIDGVTGILVDPTDAGEISDALVRLLRDPEEAAPMGRQGTLWAERLGSEWRTTLARIWSG